ncbi:hypothetical protein M011DRAFT_458021 [Sporormia fimetaria CBS 119925]|uniref:Zn(2)-C6 fungal-type domain-containing protein n=1 Tax=Sporormia fimetaria CBS 119925 TaxID=1340428 RepID=A0A6A6VG88_9PLEO|nr:hypothetical protein M011DRAFT_458021 [Sporormia fimetaria CBS 119925]
MIRLYRGTRHHVPEECQIRRKPAGGAGARGIFVFRETLTGDYLGSWVVTRSFDVTAAAMASSRRAPHNKTRFGCSGCKKRRIKCDGQQPVCVNCSKKGIECSFLQLAPFSRLASTPSQTTTQCEPGRQPPSYKVEVFRSDTWTGPKPTEGDWTSQYGTPLSSSSSVLGTPDEDRAESDNWDQFRGTLEPYQKALLERYLESTYRTLGTDVDEHVVWRNTVPEMAARHKYLVYGMLSVAALDIARLPEQEAERESLCTRAADLMNRAISLFRAELNNINKQNAAALFAHSTLTAVYFFRTSVLDMEEARAAAPADCSNPPMHIIDSIISSFVRAVWGLRGALTVLKPGWNWVVEGEVSSLCVRDWWPRNRIPKTERAKEEDRRLAALEQLWKNPHRQNEPHADCLSQALNDLRDNFILVSLLTDDMTEWPRMKAQVPYSVDDTTVGMLRDRAALFVWAIRINKTFIALCHQKDPDVLVLIAHYAILLGRIRNVWWMQGLGQNTVWAVAMALGPEKRQLIEWPAQALGIELDGSPSLTAKAEA